MSANQWTTKNIPSQSGRIALVTGANSGTGFEAAKALAQLGALVILAVRDTNLGEKAKAVILDACPAAELCVLPLDLADLQSIRAFAKEVGTRWDRLDLLINNAGIMYTPFRRTADGFEQQLGVNHLGHFALTGLLFNLIASTENSRIVTVSSMMHRLGNLRLDDLNWELRYYWTHRAYADSKLANLYFTYELARRLDEHDYVTMALAAHPGWAATNLTRHSTIGQLLSPTFGQPASIAALPILRAALDREAANGDYFGPGGLMEVRGHPKKVASNRRSQDREMAAHLWDRSAELTGVRFSFS